MDFLNVTNQYGVKRWYVDGKRVTRIVYMELVKQCQRLECFKTEVKKGYIRQYASGVVYK